MTKGNGSAKNRLQGGKTKPLRKIRPNLFKSRIQGCGMSDFDEALKNGDILVSGMLGFFDQFQDDTFGNHPISITYIYEGVFGMRGKKLSDIALFALDRVLPAAVV